MTKREDLMQADINDNEDHAKKLKELLQKTSKEMKQNKQDGDKKREKLGKNVDYNKEQLGSVVKQLQDIINRNQKEAHQMSTQCFERISKLKDKVEELKYIVKEDEDGDESESSSEEELPKLPEPTQEIQLIAIADAPESD